ncbi:MAG: TolC family protein [Planctomycetota bacterium]
MAVYCWAVLLSLGLLAGCNRQAYYDPRSGPQAGAGPAWRMVSPGTSPDQLPEPPATQWPENLQQARIQALLYNPSLKALYHQYRAALEQIPQVTSWQDPKLTYTFYIRSTETRVGPQRHGVQLAQMIPAPGELDLRGRQAAAKARAAAEQFEARRLEIVRQVTARWAELYYLGRSIRVTGENRKLLEDLEQVVMNLYRTQKASRGDLIRIQIERGRVADRLQALQQQVPAAAAALAAVLGIDPETEISLPGSLELRQVQLDAPSLVRQARQDNPAVRALQARIDAAEAAIELAGKEYWPNLGVGVGWIQTDRRHHVNVDDNGKDPWMVSATLSIPIWRDRLAAGVRQARALRTARSLDLAQLRDDLAARVARAVYDYRDAIRRDELYRQLILPKSREALKVVTASYRSGAATFTDLVDAQRVNLEFELAWRRARADAAIAQAALEELTATALDSGPATGQGTGRGTANVENMDDVNDPSRNNE